MSDFSALRTTMVDTQIRPSDVTKFPIIDAFLSVPREKFVDEGDQGIAYAGDILTAGGRAMLEPRTLAKMLDAVNVAPTDMVLDIGCGLGYSSAVLAHLAEAVVALEEGEDRAADAQSRLSENGADNVAVIEAALTEGAAKHGPYDVILLEGGVCDVPQPLLDQLKTGGRIAALFVEGMLGRVFVGFKSETGITWRFAFNASAPILNGFEKSEEFQL